MEQVLQQFFDTYMNLIQAPGSFRHAKRQISQNGTLTSPIIFTWPWAVFLGGHKQLLGACCVKDGFLLHHSTSKCSILRFQWGEESHIVNHFGFGIEIGRPKNLNSGSQAAFLFFPSNRSLVTYCSCPYTPAESTLARAQQDPRMTS